MYRYKPSKDKAQAYKDEMQAIEAYCRGRGISHSASYDSYYFTVGGTDYRVSNHTIEASNACAYDEDGNIIRPLYHDGGRQANTVYIHASKTRIIEIHTALQAGYKLDGRGNRVFEAQ